MSAPLDVMITTGCDAFNPSDAFGFLISLLETNEFGIEGYWVETYAKGQEVFVPRDCLVKDER